MTIPCYAVGAISYVVIGRISDRQQRRGIWVLALGTVSTCGYGMLISNGGPAVHYAGCFLVATGMFVVIGLPLAWLPTNLPRYGKRTTAIAMQAMIGNSAGIMASFLYPKEQGPRYVKGHAITMAMLIFGVVTISLVWVYYMIANKRRLDGKEDHKIQGLSDSEVEELGDKSPRFVYNT